ncbi:MAG: thioesterase family protein [Desulfobacterales bacterium]|nr:thioesterase family protein [Desulfobacterales bacterium]MCF8079404.1 thioesterase family protein [Desulfobacterales bacterium]
MSRSETENLQDLLDIVKDIYEKRIPFDRVLGMKVEALTLEKAVVGFQMKPELVGNYVLGSLHGGVISAVLDALGGMTASTGVVKRMAGRPVEEIAAALTRMGTIDLRIDYLRPGKGAYFKAAGTIMRAGKKVAVTRMELHNDKGVLIAVGTGTYLVG